MKRQVEAFINYNGHPRWMRCKISSVDLGGYFVRRWNNAKGRYSVRRYFCRPDEVRNESK